MRPKKTMTPPKIALASYLSRWWQSADVDRVVASYFNGGIEAAVAEVAYMDDEEHDYQHEMRQCILEWEAAQK